MGVSCLFGCHLIQSESFVLRASCFSLPLGLSSLALETFPTKHFCSGKKSTRMHSTEFRDVQCEASTICPVLLLSVIEPVAAPFVHGLTDAIFSQADSSHSDFFLSCMLP